MPINGVGISGRAGKARSIEKAAASPAMPRQARAHPRNACRFCRRSALGAEQLKSAPAASTQTNAHEITPRSSQGSAVLKGPEIPSKAQARIPKFQKDRAQTVQFGRKSADALLSSRAAPPIQTIQHRSNQNQLYRQTTKFAARRKTDRAVRPAQIAGHRHSDWAGSSSNRQFAARPEPRCLSMQAVRHIRASSWNCQIGNHSLSCEYNPDPTVTKCDASVQVHMTRPAQAESGQKPFTRQRLILDSPAHAAPCDQPAIWNQTAIWRPSASFQTMAKLRSLSSTPLSREAFKKLFPGR